MRGRGAGGRSGYGMGMVQVITNLALGMAGKPGPPSRLVAIVVPLSTRAELAPDEQVSLRHLRRHLGRYDRFLLAPEGLDPGLDDFRVKRFPRRFFGSAAAHGRLLYSWKFYKCFEDYEYVFFYHLDSLVFSDQLEDWCRAGIDYIGPPWIPCEDSPWVKQARVGNGGFTLLRVASALRVFANRYRAEPKTYWLDTFSRNARPWMVRVVERIARAAPRMPVVRALAGEWRRSESPEACGRNNDLFWSDRAVGYLPEFRVATLEQGLRFGFEVAPRRCLEMAGGRMPFGCHAWARYDRAFWEPHLLAGG